MRTLFGLLALVLVLAAIAAVAWLDGGIMAYPDTGRLIAERAALPLTAAACEEEKDDPLKKRMCLAQSSPIGAYASYRRCGGYIESERVGAVRIACSKPELLDTYFKFGEGQSAYRDFRRACRLHDFCYVHGMATYDPKSGDFGAQDRCDRQLLADAIRDCRLLFPNKPDILRKCRWAAMAAYTGVRWKGHQYFAKWNQAACDYEPGAHGPRDQVVSGRFLAAGPDGVVTLVADRATDSLTVEYHQLDDSGGSARRAALEGLSPALVRVADGAQACASAPWTEAGVACPATLGEAGVKSEDWLRFPPIVVDADGDGADEIVLVTLKDKVGLAFTHLKIQLNGETIEFAAPQGFIAFNDSKEFWSATREVHAPLSDERPIQMLAHEFVPVQRAPQERCAVLPETGPQDILLLGGRAEDGYLAIAHRMYRFTFNADQQRWMFLRDRFNDDRHKMRYCDKEHVGSFSQGTRLQYPAIAVRGPVKCSGRTILGETLSTVVREKCPTSTVSAKAGDLNDIDLLSYRSNPNFVGGDDKGDVPTLLDGARVSWQPVIWNEAGDPVLTSRYARRLGVALVSTYTGGTKTNRYPLIKILRHDLRLEQSTKEDWRERQPDTLGVTPVQYALYESSRTAEVQTWNAEKFGDPAMFSHIPSVLAPFWTDGTPGLSLVMFANRASFERDNVARPFESVGTRADVLKRGTVQILITPIADAIRPPSDPRWLECPVPSGADLAQDPARPMLRWRSDFLYQEPALPGRYFAGEKGGLAIAYRTTEGRIALTTLQNRPNGSEADAWWLGAKACTSLSAKKPDGSAPDRHVWMMRLN